MTVEQETLLKRLRAIESRKSPWTRLPVETISHILVSATEITDNSHRYLPGGKEGAAVRRFPLVASAISSHFRSIALSTPALWKNIYLGRAALPPLEMDKRCEADNLDREDVSSYQLCNKHRAEDLSRTFAQLREASLWLERSKTAPLSVYVVNPVSIILFA